MLELERWKGHAARILTHRCFHFGVALRPQKPSGLLGTGSPGLPPQLVHSSWTLSRKQAGNTESSRRSEIPRTRETPSLPVWGLLPASVGLEMEYKTRRRAIEQLFLNPIHLLCRDNAVRFGAFGFPSKLQRAGAWQNCRLRSLKI